MTTSEFKLLHGAKAIAAELGLSRRQVLHLLENDRIKAARKLGGVFGDAVVATAILDRLLHHSHVITIRGDSYRLRAKRRSGLLQKATATPPATELIT
jgi:hypothetical protein